MTPLRILHLEDSPLDAELIRTRLAMDGVQATIVHVSSAEQYVDALLHNAFDVILADFQLPSFDGLSALKLAQQHCPQIPFVFASGTLGEETAVGMLKLGATDYVVKQRIHQLAPALTRAVEEAQNRAAKQRAEHALRDSEKRYRALTELSPQVIWMGNRDGQLTYCNQRWVDLSGLTLEQSLGTGWLAAIHPDARDAVAAAWADTSTKRAPGEVEAQIKTTTDRYRWHLLRVASISDEFEVAGQWIGIAVDIEDRRQAENQIRKAAAQAEEANRMKDHFLATLSHELRTPLTAIVGWSQLIAEGNLTPTEIEEAARVIDRSATAQAHLIEDLLDVSRIASGKMSLAREPVALHEVVEAALESMHGDADGKGVTLHLEIASRQIRVSGDSGRLRQVVGNLLSNAIKFTPSGGTVTIRLNQTNSLACISVADTGAGIRADFLPHIFSPFSQAENASTTRVHGGLGLGLSIVRQIVELHGGRVTVVSPGEQLGSTFSVFLPVLESSLASEALTTFLSIEFDDTSKCPETLAGLHVLLVDDDHDARAIVRRVLADCDAVVAEAASVQEALELLELVRPSVLVSDIGMPHEDGYELIRRIRAQGCSLPAIALTAFARAEDRLHVLQSGFQAHIAKPVKPKALLSAIASLANNR